MVSPDCTRSTGGCALSNQPHWVVSSVAGSRCTFLPFGSPVTRSFESAGPSAGYPGVVMVAGGGDCGAGGAGGGGLGRGGGRQTTCGAHCGAEGELESCVSHASLHDRPLLPIKLTHRGLRQQCARGATHAG